MLNECLSEKGTAKLYIQFFRLKKKSDLNNSTRSTSEILKPFKKVAFMYNQNLEIHSRWSFKQYLKFDCSIDELPNHTDSPLSKRTFC